MNSLKMACVFMCACVAWALGGCVPPGEIDQNVLTRYQNAMAQRSPQSRKGDARLGLLQPVGKTGPALRLTAAHDGQTAQVRLTLDEAVQRTVINNLQIRIVSFNPEVTRQEMIEAAAAFDYVMFSSYNFQQDSNVANNASQGKTQTQDIAAGLREKMVTGGTWQLAYSVERTLDNSLFVNSRKTYMPQTTLSLVQPLLRDAWPEFNLAQLHIAQLSQKISEANFRQQVEATVTQTVATYWQLVQARQDLRVQRELVAMTDDTLRRVKERGQLDVTNLQIKQSEAALETNRAVVYQYQTNVQDIQDQLVRLMADSQITLLGDFEIVPESPPAATLIQYDVTDQLVTALEFNPLLEQARLAIEQAQINVRVAQNQALPRLDFSGGFGFEGLDSNFAGANTNLAHQDNLNFGAGVNFEYPIGNRAAEAEVKRQRLLKLQAVTALQDTADTIAVEIKTAIRKIQRGYDQLQAQRAATAAGRIELQAIEDTERVREKLTPEFLQLKLQAQETLASSEHAEAQALFDYNSALIELAQVAGTVLKDHSVEISMPKSWSDSTWPQRLLDDADQAAKHPATTTASSPARP